MVGPTLVDIREHIETLAAADGQYYVICGRTGDRPVPAAGCRFRDRATARGAARATEQYRSALRRYDPQVPYYDLIVCEETSDDPAGTDRRDCSSGTPRQHLSEPVLPETTTPEQRTLVEFCHRVAGVVFETISEAGYDGLESAVMDAYFELAETVENPDELCLYLLESMASELDEHLSLSNQSDLFLDAAARLEQPDGANNPFDATLSVLEKRGLIESYTRTPQPTGLDDSTETTVAQISGYALSSRSDRLPVLPVTLELCRHRRERSPQSVRVTAVDGGWQLTFAPAETVEQDSLVSAPIRRDAI
jgi:hypothetical protein